MTEEYIKIGLFVALSLWILIGVCRWVDWMDKVEDLYDDNLKEDENEKEWNKRNKH